MSERQVLEKAMQAVHAFHKWDLAIESAVTQWEQGERDTPENEALIKRYSEATKQLSFEAIDMYDQLKFHEAE